MTLSNEKCQFLYKKKIGRTLLYEVSPNEGVFYCLFSDYEREAFL